MGVPDCDQIRCPKLDGVLKVVLTKDAIKADGYLSRLHQLWLDAVAPLTAALESAEEGDLTPEKAVRDAQTALYLMGNAHQQMAQERRKKMILKLNPSLKFMAEEQKNFNTAAPMLFEEEFTKQVTATVEQVKAIKKLNIPEEKKGLFSFRVPPPKLSSRLQGWLQERPFKIPAIQKKREQPTSPQPAQEAIKDKGTINTHYCKLSKSNHKLSPYFRFKCCTALNKEGYTNKSACRPNKRVQRELAPVNTRPMGTSNSARISTATGGSTSASDSSTTNVVCAETKKFNISGSANNVRETSNNRGSAWPGGFYISNISSIQERWRLSASSKFEGLKQVHSRGALQDGGLPHGERSSETTRLVSQV